MSLHQTVSIVDSDPTSNVAASEGGKKEINLLYCTVSTVFFSLILY